MKRRIVSFALLHPIPILCVGLIGLAVPQRQYPPGFTSQALAAEAASADSLNPLAPRETHYLGQLVGNWGAVKSIRQQDGTWREEKTQYEWCWYYILDGHALQDDWIELTNSSDGTVTRASVGTNLRIYNADERQWQMAWIDKDNRRLATFTATNEKDAIVMKGHNARGQQIRNTFFDVTQKSFDWKQEWTRDGGQTWFEVVRIHCIRKD